tara:strand:+ start:3493 stop:3732 length:240 start_codon:yes stop_codon:yes gene_type:complete
MSEGNVISIMGKDYDESSLDENQIYLVNQLRQIQPEYNNLKMKLDRLEVARERFLAELIHSVREQREEDDKADSAVNQS